MYPRYKHSKIQHRRKRGCFFILENTKWHLNAYVVVLSVLKDINNLKHPVALEKHTWQQHYIFLHVHDLLYTEDIKAWEKSLAQLSPELENKHMISR